jgi:hypothetical protein
VSARLTPNSQSPTPKGQVVWRLGVGSWALKLALILCVSASARAQSDDGVLSVQDGDRVRPIAHVEDGKWISDVKCAPNDSRSSATSETLRVSGELRQSPVRAIMSGSQEWLRLAPTIVELFERREREQRLSDRTSDAPRAVDWIYATDTGAQRMYYFEASRRVSSVSPDVDHDTDPPGTVRIAVAGFLHDVQGRLTPLGTKSELRWEQDGLPAGPSRPDLAPLGVVAYRGRSIWIMRGQSGANRWFTLYDVSAEGTRTVLTTRASGC